MRNNFKRFLGVAFVLIMALSVMTVGAFAAEETVAKIGDAEYTTLAKAIAGAVAGDTITLTADVTENVTINKSITIDGDDNQYTGTMTISDNKNVTIKNVDFVKGCIDEVAGSHGYLTINDCDFDGVDKSIGYAINHRGGDKLIIENTTAKNYKTGMLYIPSSVASISVKDVEVNNVAAAFNITYSGDGTFENVKFNNVTYGIHFMIYGSRTYTVKNSDLSGATNPFWFWDKSNNACKVTVAFEGENIVPVFQNPIPAGALKLAEGATLTAPEGLDITTDVEDSYVAYKNGVYSVEANTKVAAIGTKKYATLAGAVADAKDGDVITIVADYALKNSEAAIADYDMYAYIAVTDKKITIDLNGKKLTAAPELDKNLLGLVYVGGNGQLTLKDSSAAQTGSVVVTTENTKAYSLMTLDSEDADARLYIESGNYYIDRVDAGQSMIYANDGDRVFVSGGNFVLANAKTMDNKGVAYPWIFNASGNTGVNYVTVSGGTYNVDPTHHQGEVRYPNCYKAIENDGTWTVKYAAMAEIDGYGYWTIKDAVAAAKDGDVITIIADQTLTNSDAFIESAYNQFYVFAEVSDKNITIDLNGKVITINSDLDKMLVAAIYSIKDGEITLKDSSEAQTGAINVNASETSSVYSMFAADEGGKFNIENGNYYLNRVDLNARAPRALIYTSDDMNFTVNGGNFVLGNARTSTDINGKPQPWIFNGLRNGQNHVYVTGGTYNAYPQNPWNEAKYPYCYDAIENEDGTWTVKYSPAVEIGETGYESLKEAVAAAKDGDVITVRKDQELNNADAAIADYDMYSYITVSDKKITIDLNGKTITANPKFDKALYGVIVVNGTGDVTLTDSSTDKTGAINVTVAEGTGAYSMLSTDGATSKLTINGGNYYIDRVDKGYSMIYIAQTGTGYVNGGNFVLGNAKTMIRSGVAVPWIFNTVGNAKNVVYVNGGRYNTDPDHRWGEAKFKKGYVTVQAADGMWDIVRGPVIIEQPTDITINYGKMAKFAPVIKGEGLTYTWYYKDAKTSWYKSSLTTATYDIKGTAARDGRQVYCVATDITGKSVKTGIATLTVLPNEELAIIDQPEVVEGTLNKNVSVALNVTGDDLTYVWYYSDNGGKSYYKSSLTTATYDIILKEERMGRKVYCVITDAFGDTVKSDVITINAKQSVELKLLSAPVYEAAEVGKTAKITLDVQGEGLKYTWYYSLPGKTTLYKSTITDSEYKITLSKDRIGRQVYCVITDAFGNQITTETVTLYAAE